MSTSKKQEVFDKIKDKMSIDDAELNKIYADCEKQFKDRGVTPTEDLVLNRMNAFLSPSLRSTATKHLGIFLGVEDNFGFNQIADKVKKDSMEKEVEDAENAVTMGFINANGEPLWHATTEYPNCPDFKVGKPITNFDYSATVYVLVSKEKDFDKEKFLKGTFELKTLTVRGDRRDTILKSHKEFAFKPVQFMATEKENTMNDSKYLNMKVLDTQEINVGKMIGKFAKKNCVDLKDVNEFYQKNADTIKSLPVFIRGSTGRIIVSEDKSNDIIEFKDIGYNKDFGIFHDKKLELPPEGAVGVVFGGKLKYKENDEGRPFSLNSFMVYVPQEFKDFDVPDSIKKHLNQQEVEEVKDTTKSQQMIKAKVKTEW